MQEKNTAFEQVFAKWQRDVERFKNAHGIAEFQAKYLKVGDLFDTEFAKSYTAVINAFQECRRTPESNPSFLRLNAAIRNWYAAAAQFDKKPVKAAAINVMPINMFAKRYVNLCR